MTEPSPPPLTPPDNHRSPSQRRQTTRLVPFVIAGIVALGATLDTAAVVIAQNLSPCSPAAADALPGLVVATTAAALLFAAGALCSILRFARGQRRWVDTTQLVASLFGLLIGIYLFANIASAAAQGAWPYIC